MYQCWLSKTEMLAVDFNRKCTVTSVSIVLQTCQIHCSWVDNPIFNTSLVHLHLDFIHSWAHKLESDYPWRMLRVKGEHKLPVNDSSLPLNRVLLQNMLPSRWTISPLHQYSGSGVVQLVGQSGKACVPSQRREKKWEEVQQRPLELSLSSAQVFDQYKKSFWKPLE